MKLRHHVPRLAPLIAAAWLALGAAPAQSGLFDDEVARKQIADLERRINTANQRQEQLAAQISTRLAAMEESQKAPNQPVLELATQLQSLREEMRSLRGQIEVLTNTVESNAKRQRDMYVDLDSRLRRFESASAAPGGAAPVAPGAAPVTPGTAPAMPGAAAPATPAATVASTGTTASASTSAPAPLVDDKTAYEAAQNLRRNGNYLAAIGAFQQFIVQYPKSPLANRAQYWIGDSYYNLRDYKSAVASQQKLLATYPDSPSAPDALLNMATAQMELGELRAARTTMTNLVSRYPSSDAAEKAKRRLATLR